MSRLRAPVVASAVGVGGWLADVVRGSGWLWCRSEPLADGATVRALFPDGVSADQAETWRPLLTPAEFATLRPATDRGLGR
jgi:hypothetical protein